MEKLTAEQQQQIKKMSNDRLRVKLTAAGYDEETVVATEREVMMTTYAEVVATGGENCTLQQSWGGLPSSKSAGTSSVA